MTSMVPVQILGIQLGSEAGTSAVLLGEPDEMTHVLPIVIGATEAQSIARSFTGAVGTPPCTHDLATTLMAAAGSRLEEVVITDFRDGTFSAELIVETVDGMRSLPARPSDGIALAVRVGAPIYVRSNVLNQAAVAIDHRPATPLSEAEIDRIVGDFQAFLDSTDTVDVDSEHWTPHEGEPDEDIGWGDED